MFKPIKPILHDEAYEDLLDQELEYIQLNEKLNIVDERVLNPIYLDAISHQTDMGIGFRLFNSYIQRIYDIYDYNNGLQYDEFLNGTLSLIGFNVEYPECLNDFCRRMYIPDSHMADLVSQIQIGIELKDLFKMETIQSREEGLVIFNFDRHYSDIDALDKTNPGIKGFILEFGSRCICDFYIPVSKTKITKYLNHVKFNNLSLEQIATLCFNIIVSDEPRYLFQPEHLDIEYVIERIQQIYPNILKSTEWNNTVEHIRCISTLVDIKFNDLDTTIKLFQEANIDISNSCEIDINFN